MHQPFPWPPPLPQASCWSLPTCPSSPPSPCAGFCTYLAGNIYDWSPCLAGIVLEPANVPYQAALSACQAELLARLGPKGSNGLAFTSPLPSLIVGLPR